MNSSGEYLTDSSDYVSSVVSDNTPFPSLTKSQKVKILQTFKPECVSVYEATPLEPEALNEEFTYEEHSETSDSAPVKNSCCYLI